MTGQFLSFSVQTGVFVASSETLVMRTKSGAGVRTTFWSVQGEGPVSFLKGLG